MSMTIELKFTGQLNEPHRQVAEQVIEAIKVALDNAELAYNPTANISETKQTTQRVKFPYGEHFEYGSDEYDSSYISFMTTVHKD